MLFTSYRVSGSVAAHRQSKLIDKRSGKIKSYAAYLVTTENAVEINNYFVYQSSLEFCFPESYC